MIRIKHFFNILLYGFITVSCSNNHNLSAEIKGLGNDTIFVEYLPIAQYYQLEEPMRDTIYSNNDRFVYDIPSNDTVIAYFFPKKGEFERLDRTTYRPVYLDIVLRPDDEVSIKGKLNTYSIDYEMHGSKIYDGHSILRKKYLDKTAEAIMIELQLDTLIFNNGDQALINNLFKRRNEIFDLVRTEKLKFIKSNWDKDLSALYLTDQRLDTIGKYYNNLSPDIKGGIFNPMLEYQYVKYQKFIKVREAEANIQEGKIAPDFNLKLLDGTDFKLGTINNKYIVLDFWGSWCAPCIAGIPKMKDYYKKYYNQLEIVGIACKDSEENWKQSIQQNNLEWLNVINDNDINRDVSVLYGIKSYPTKILLDMDRKIVAKFIGEGDDFYNKLDELFRK